MTFKALCLLSLSFFWLSAFGMEDDQEYLSECTEWMEEHYDPQLPQQLELCLSNPEIMKQLP